MSDIVHLSYISVPWYRMSGGRFMLDLDSYLQGYGFLQCCLLVVCLLFLLLKVSGTFNPNSHGLSFCLKTTGGGLPGPPLLLCDLTIDYHKLDT